MQILRLALQIRCCAAAACKRTPSVGAGRPAQQPPGEHLLAQQPATALCLCLWQQAGCPAPGCTGTRMGPLHARRCARQAARCPQPAPQRGSIADQLVPVAGQLSPSEVCLAGLEAVVKGPAAPFPERHCARQAARCLPPAAQRGCQHHLFAAQRSSASSPSLHSTLMQVGAVTCLCSSCHHGQKQLQRKLRPQQRLTQPAAGSKTWCTPGKAMLG